MGGQHFDGDIAIEPRVARPIDLAHPAAAERLKNLVRTEPGAGRHVTVGASCRTRRRRWPPRRAS